MEAPSPNMGNASFVLGYAEKTKQNISAITDYQTGANQYAKSQTATEIQTKTFLSEQRTNKILQRFEREVLELSGKMALWLNKQYIQDKEIYRILGKKGRLQEKKIDLKTIEAIKDVVIVGGSSAYIDRNMEMQKWASLLNLSTQEVTLQQMGVPIDRETIWRRLLEDGYGIKDPENYIPSLKERESANVVQKNKDLQQAKQENLDPINARVMPDDNHKEIHLPVHQAALRNGGMTDDNGQFAQYTPEQMQALTEHINKHVEAGGGQNPSFAQAIEQGYQQRITGNINPNGQTGAGVPGTA
jgi:hypothetical protein